VEEFVIRGRSVWCGRCGDQVTIAGDPLAVVSCRAHVRGCAGRMSQVPLKVELAGPLDAWRVGQGPLGVDPRLLMEGRWPRARRERDGGADGGRDLVGGLSALPAEPRPWAALGR
jgi:hypothetical protein